MKPKRIIEAAFIVFFLSCVAFELFHQIKKQPEFRTTQTLLLTPEQQEKVLLDSIYFNMVKEKLNIK